MHKTAEVEKIRDISETESLVYQVTDAPWPEKDQDNVLYSKWTQDSKTLIVTKKILSEPQHINEFKSRQRQQFFNAEWQLKPLADGQVEVSYTAEMHPGSKEVSSWMVSLLAYEMPIKTMQNLRNVSLSSYTQMQFAFVTEPTAAVVAVSAAIDAESPAVVTPPKK